MIAPELDRDVATGGAGVIDVRIRKMWLYKQENMGVEVSE